MGMVADVIEPTICDPSTAAAGASASFRSVLQKTGDDPSLLLDAHAGSRRARVAGREILKGVNLEGGITVEKAIETDSVLATKIDSVIKGAQVVRSEWTADDGCVVILRLGKKALKDMGLKLIKE